MSIGPIGGAGSPAIVKPESMEAPGMPDRDHDSDDSPAGAAAQTRTTGAPVQRGRLDVKV